MAEIIPDGIDGWQSLPLINALRSDLRDLGYPNDDAGNSGFPSLDADRLLGALYVLEGSSLGARILVQRAATLGFSEQHGARHLALQTSDRMRWARFVEILEQHGSAHPDAVVRGAKDAFAHALQSFLVDLDDD